MKKKLLWSNLGWLTLTLVIITHSCNQSTPAASQPPAPCAEDEVGFMDAKFFLDGIARYKQYQWPADNNAMQTASGIEGFQDAIWCWYSLDRLKNMICLTEKNARDHGLIGELGIRFYYATYPDSIKQTILHPTGPTVLKTTADVGWHHTLFMVPTCYNKGLHLDEDIYLMPKRFYSGNADSLKRKESTDLITHPDWVMLQKHTGEPQYKIMVLGTAATIDPSSKNQGMLCPPTCQ